VVGFVGGLFFGEFFYTLDCTYAIMNFMEKEAVISFTAFNWDNEFNTYIWVLS
jgi:hypothetical protein